jgi:hypothetical protein
MAWDSLLTFNETGVTANLDGGALNVGSTGLVKVEVDVSKVAGTDQVLDVSIQDSPDAVNFENASGIISFTEADKKYLYFRTNKKYVRYSLQVSGTSPSFDVGIRMK